MSTQTLTQGERTRRFFALAGEKVESEILENIAKHYGITRDHAKAEVCHDEAEYLLDYVTGPMRAAASALMQRHGLAVY
jgi:hypothetical protein